MASKSGKSRKYGQSVRQRVAANFPTQSMRLARNVVLRVTDPVNTIRKTYQKNLKRYQQARSVINAFRPHRNKDILGLHRRFNRRIALDPTPDRHTETPGLRRHCRRRYARRATLFSLGIAGRGRRNSPGSGPRGHRYKRTSTSSVRCH